MPSFGVLQRASILGLPFSSSSSCPNGRLIHEAAHSVLRLPIEKESSMPRKLFPTLSLSFVIIALHLISPSRALAFSGFLKPPGSGYVSLTFTSLSSSDLYSTEGALLPSSGEFTQNNLSLYGEVGVLKHLTLGASIPLTRFNSFDTSDVATGFGDLSVFAKTGLQFLGFHGALIVWVELPTGRNEFPVDTEFEGITTNLPTGDGETNVWYRLALSRSIPLYKQLSSYVSIYGGFNHRTQFNNQLGAGGQIGFSLPKWGGLEFSLDALITPADTEDLDPSGVFLFGDGTEYVAGRIAAYAEVPKTPLQVTVSYRNTFANLRNLYAGTTLGVGIAAQW